MNINDKVLISECKNYNYENLLNKLKEVFEGLGGIKKYIKDGTKVLIKPNLIMMKNPSYAATTNPLFVKAVCELIIEAGGIVTIAESPGGPYNSRYLDMVYSVCQIKKIAKELNVKINYDTGYREIDFKINERKRKCQIINPVFENDIIINLPKLKTHMMSNYTGAVKNIFGLVPGLTKANYHFKYSKKEDFFEFIADLCLFIKPTLNIADAIDIMEGDGPSNGQKRNLGLILASENPFNLDYIGHSLFGFSKNDVYTSLFGEKYEIQPADINDINTNNFNLNDYIMSDLKKPNIMSGTFDEKIPKFLRKYVRNIMTPYPKFLKDRCIKCSNCINICPAKDLELYKGAPRLIDKSKCIRCYCCHEMCPKNAVKLRKIPKILR